MAGKAGAAAAVKGMARLRVLSGKATPSPAIGQALGPLGVNMAEFCKKFNDDTAKLTPGMPVPTLLTAYEDRTYSFEMKTPPTSWFLKQVSGVDKGSKTPGKEFVGKVSVKHIYEIAKIKKTDAHQALVPIESLSRSVASTAKSMGLRVVH